MSIISTLKLVAKGVPLTLVKSAGTNFYCGKRAHFRRGERIEIGNNVFMGNSVHIACPCIIRDDVMIASYVSIVGGDHRFDQPAVLMNSSGRSNPKTIIIEEDVWIGHGSIIMNGVTIGRGAIVAAGSVVTKSIPPCTIWGSNPAKFLRDRFKNDSEKELHLNFLNDKYKTLR